MSKCYEDFRDQVDYQGVNALVYAICSANSDEIAVYNEEKSLWTNKRWAINGNYITEVKCGKDIEGVTVQEALDRFHITPFVEASEMRKEGYVE